MNDLMDRVWESFEVLLMAMVTLIDRVVSPLEFLGPAWVIFFLTLAVVGFTRLVARLYSTKRYLALEKEFKHWHGVREKAAQYHDREKGKAMAKNIDQAKLNKVYYDYFFEGLLKNLITNVLPILLMVAYLSIIYNQENLMTRFGEKWIFTIAPESASPVYVGSLFWYIICLAICFSLWGAARFLYKKGKSH
jgi:uncharacterized membrane protein (DUF106 family)